MTGWYTVGLFAGLGVALGIAFVGLLGARKIALAAPFLAGAIGALVGVALADAEEAVGAALGGVLGAVGSFELVRGALGRGGTRPATAFLVLLGAAAVALLAFVPLLGYIELVAVPALGMRLRRRGGKRYAGLRTLARD